MTQMTREQAEAEIAEATETYKTTCTHNRAELLTPVLHEIQRLNALARKTKDERVRSLKAWLDVLASQPAPPCDGE